MCACVRACVCACSIIKHSELPLCVVDGHFYKFPLVVVEVVVADHVMYLVLQLQDGDFEKGRDLGQQLDVKVCHVHDACHS